LRASNYAARASGDAAGTPGTPPDEDLSAKGDIVRARLTIKTSGYRFFY
jgi:hypothetical protein